MVSISPSIDYLERAYDDAVDGRFSRAPYIDIGFPSAIDPSVAPPGKHVMACFVQYAPYELAEGTWDDQREAFGDTVQATIAKYAPDLPGLVVGRQVLTPIDIERTFGLTEGNIFQGELLLEQLFSGRPMLGSGYGTPVRDLWICGSSTHPGGAISGAPGRNAAVAILRARRGRPAKVAAGGRVSYDAIVIGGGHNGLVCAAYLGRAGLRTLVLEARDSVGGMADLALTVGRLSPTVARELGLRRHGLRLVQPDAQVFAPQPDGRGLTLWGDAALTARELADNPLVGAADADRYASVDGELRAVARSLAPILRRIPPDLTGVTTGATVRSVAGLTRVGPRLWRLMPMAVRDLVEEWFESDALRAAVAARGVLYTALGPRMPGTGQVLLTDAASSNGGLAGQTVFARGGPGALSKALADAVRATGGEIRTAARVTRIKRVGDRTTGVVLEGGDEIDANVVVSNLDPKTTLLDLLEPEVLGPRLSWRADNIRQNGATASVTYTLRALPVFPAAYDDGRRLRGRISSRRRCATSISLHDRHVTA